DGISIADDWDVMGMRATGSQTIEFADVFIPDSAIALSRPKDEFHPVWGVVLTVALPLIMAAYVGIAEKAFQIALDKGKKSSGNSDQLSYMIGKLNNSLLSAQSQLKMMSTLTNDFDFKPNDINNVQVLSYKTNISEATKQVVSEAMEIVGGQSFYRSNTLERLFRDVQASPFHPLPKWDQYKFTGDRLLNS
ncbi:MAG: alkylation response protein AidB-like acyl-CoA dehydrogenase, partial [Glaciecola sp.]